MSKARASLAAVIGTGGGGGGSNSSSSEETSFGSSIISFLFSAKWAKMKARMQNVAEGPVVSSIMMIMTLWSLFDEDIRLYATKPEADLAFMVIISIIFFAFWIEIFAACLYRNEYFQYPDLSNFSDPNPRVRLMNYFAFGSFYVWSDILATISLISEVKFL